MYILSIQKQPPEVFLRISQNSQENTCVRVSFLIKLQVSGFKNTYFKNICKRLVLSITNLREATAYRVPQVKVFLKISQNSQENA